MKDLFSKAGLSAPAAFGLAILVTVMVFAISAVALMVAAHIANIALPEYVPAISYAQSVGVVVAFKFARLALMGFGQKIQVRKEVQ